MLALVLASKHALLLLHFEYIYIYTHRHTYIYSVYLRFISLSIARLLACLPACLTDCVFSERAQCSLIRLNCIFLFAISNNVD